MSGVEAYLELADSRGVYGIDWDIVPLGETFVSLDEYGPDTTWVSDTIRICAWKDGATGSVEAVLKQSGTISVDVTIE
ncbi:MAG TPA: hypothetical protein VM118_12270 [Acidobacteriota bacterium]|nr:hypothetical protein [Acidobacteriota bacterium]